MGGGFGARIRIVVSGRTSVLAIVGRRGRFFLNTLWLPIAVIGGLGLLWAVVVIPPHLVDTSAIPDPDKKLTQISNLRSAIVTTLGGIAVAAGTIVAALSLSHNRRVLEETHRQNQAQLALQTRGQISERFSRAVEQLGTEKLDLRLGAVFSLEQVARESESLHSPVIEILSAFLREHAKTSPRGMTTKLPTDWQATATIIARRDVSRDTPGMRVDLRSVDLDGAALSAGARLAGALLQAACLNRADLREADLRGADLTGCRLEQANLQGANLEGAILARANLAGATLSNANLTGADLTGGANLEEAYLRDACLVGARLNDANLTRVDLLHAHLAGADLPGANLQHAHVAGADLRDADLSSANLEETDLRSADLTGAHLRRANVRHTMFSNISPLGLKVTTAFAMDVATGESDARGLTVAQLRSVENIELASLPTYLINQPAREEAGIGETET